MIQRAGCVGGRRRPTLPAGGLMSPRKTPVRTSPDEGTGTATNVGEAIELTRLTDDDLHYFNEGSHGRLYGETPSMTPIN